MSEEEKQAIESLRKNRGVSFAQADIISNLIDKQQKEIEEFKGIKNGTTIIYKCKAKYVREDKINKYYINKNKIRKKIKELKKMKLPKGDIYLNMRNYAILILRELLEE